jgi:hypothetical protein
VAGRGVMGRALGGMGRSVDAGQGQAGAPTHS